MRYGTEAPDYRHAGRDFDYENTAYGHYEAEAYGYEDEEDWDDRLEHFAKDNTLPLALIGAGIGWMLLSGARNTETYEQARHWAGDRTAGMRSRMSSQGSGMRHRAEGAMNRLREGADHLRSQAAGAYGGAKHRAEGAYENAKHRASDTYRGTRDRTGDYYDRIADYDARSDYASSGGSYGGRSRTAEVTDRARGMMSGAGQRANRARESFWDIVDEHPLAAGLMGLALGAAIGATLPATRTEDEWMGQYRDDALDQAWRQGRDGVERAGNVAKEAARAGAEAARETADKEAHRQGVHPDDVKRKADEEEGEGKADAKA